MADPLIDPCCKIGGGIDERSLSMRASSVRTLHSSMQHSARTGKKPRNALVALPDEDADVFNIYVQWHYYEKIPCQKSEDENGYPMLGKLYVLGEKVLDKKLQDRVLDAIVATTRRKTENGMRFFPSRQVIKEIYGSTTSNSPARRLMVDLDVVHALAPWVGADETEHHPDFMFDLTKALIVERALTEEAKSAHAELASGIPCSYHQHGKDEVCSAKKL
ncbi:hypothetical protein LTR37_016925 [Vermiconidia calcicola]|uniref:Uncharacterized protein n=1 Tax=Vermiconidia calcicola TaxID=1690605 RepID=A0ACC3MLE8_9PEZI|nr:hypothetical protein LTR37_016925 [Vermiconidia calcicola]